jgi:pectin methylesterase-like acyl-CoA thioesterase
MAVPTLSPAATLTVGQDNWYPLATKPSVHSGPRDLPATSCPNLQFYSINAALSAASPGDTIAICPGFYTEQLVIAKPVTLLGLTANGIGRVLLQPALTIQQSLAAEAAITVMNSNEYIRRLHSEPGHRRQQQHGHRLQPGRGRHPLL